MKLITITTALLLSTSLFAATSYSFKCTSTADGKCSITSANAHVLKTVDTNVLGGTEGEYKLFLETASDASYMYIYKGKTVLAEAQNSTYLAVPTTDGYVGIITVDSIEQIPAFIQPTL
jgi:hypothetical protein